MAIVTLESSQNSRLQALRDKHESLSSRVREAQRSPSIADDVIRALKKQKLMIKEQIEGIRKSG